MVRYAFTFICSVYDFNYSADSGGNSKAFQDGNDLIDLSPMILNTQWGQPAEAGEKLLIKDDFPSLKSRSTTTEAITVNVNEATVERTQEAKTDTKRMVWGTGSPFAEVSPSITVSVEFLDSLATNSAPKVQVGEYNPDHPSFDINKYYIVVLGKYKCPYTGCKYVYLWYLTYSY